jgi:UDP-GlcNAc:undecaprenyl-phosphate GlcNAc-1-phosphate transferase
VIALVGLIAGVAGTWIARTFALATGIVSKPNPIVPQHKKPVAYLGGVGIAIGLAAALVFEGAWQDRSRLALAVPAAGFLALGIVDDLRPMHALPKLAIQTALAGIAVALGAGAHITGLAPVDAALSAAWIVLLVNSVNVTDVCDGLVAGLSAIGLAMVGFVAPGFRGPAWGLAGACAGFLLLNRPPATIFMGDAGSLLLGFAVAAATLRLFDTIAPGPAFVMALAAAAPFLFETALLVSSRVRKNLPWWKGSPDHFSLRMQAAGLSKWRTDLTSWLLVAAVCAAAAFLPGAAPWAPWALVAAMAAIAWQCARWLVRHEVVR